MFPDEGKADLRQWFSDHGPFLYCWMRARLGPALRRDLDVEDMLQEVWVRASQVQADETVAHPRAWLLKIAGYVFLEAVRSSRQRARLAPVPADTSRQLIDEITSLTRRIARDEARQRFFGELDGLPDDERTLLVMHGLEARPIAHAAERLGITVDAAHKRWQRLRERLRVAGAPADLL